MPHRTGVSPRSEVPRPLPPGPPPFSALPRSPTPRSEPPRPQVVLALAPSLLQPAPRSACCRQAGLTPRWELRPWGSMRPALGTGSSLDRTDGALAGRPWRCRCGPPAGCTARVGIPASVWPGCLGATSARPRERGASRVLVGCPRRGTELAAAVPALTLGRACPRGLPASPLMASLLHAGVRTGPQPERERPQTRPGEGNAAPPGRLGGGGRGCGAARASPLAPLCSLRSPRPPWAPDPGSLRPSPHSASAGSPPREAGRQRPRPGRRSRQAGTSGLWVMQRPLERTPLQPSVGRSLFSPCSPVPSGVGGHSPEGQLAWHSCAWGAGGGAPAPRPTVLLRPRR